MEMAFYILQICNSSLDRDHRSKSTCENDVSSFYLGVRTDECLFRDFDRFAFKRFVQNYMNGSWFYQFYLFATIFYTYLFFSLIRVYILGLDLPLFTQFLLDNVVGPNRRARVESESVLLALILILVQVVRRLLECLFLSVYSEAKMNVCHYVIAMSYYFGVGLSILAEANGLSNTPSFISHTVKWPNFLKSTHLLGITLFVVASYLHYKSHHILASLRKDKQGKIIYYKHIIPRGGLFEWVSCPHYFAEILIYISLAIVQNGLSLTWWLVVCFVITNQVIVGLINHQWYTNTFHDYPKKRKAVIPFLI